MASKILFVPYCNIEAGNTGFLIQYKIKNLNFEHFKVILTILCNTYILPNKQNIIYYQFCFSIITYYLYKICQIFSRVFRKMFCKINVIQELDLSLLKFILIFFCLFKF